MNEVIISIWGKASKLENIAAIICPMAQEYCESAQQTCDPTKCIAEFCEWRDIVWAPTNLERLTYQGPTDWIYRLASPKNASPNKKKNRR